MYRTSLTIPTSGLPTPYPRLCIPLDPPESPPSRAPRFTPGSGHAALQAKREHWATLTLRQDWADAEFMRAHLKAAGLTIKYSAEPATARRVRCVLRKAGVTKAEAQVSIGTDLAGYLALNPGLPLWAAVALVLEATGRFTPKAAA